MVPPLSCSSEMSNRRNICLSISTYYTIVFPWLDYNAKLHYILQSIRHDGVPIKPRATHIINPWSQINTFANILKASCCETYYFRYNSKVISKLF